MHQTTEAIAKACFEDEVLVNLPDISLEMWQF
jgi:hypothetical protein